MAFKIGFLLISLFIGSLALPSPAKDATDSFIHSEQSSRIVGGSIAPEGGVPYMAAMTNGLLIRSYYCGGSIVTNRLVLTAAHCVAAVYNDGSLSNSLRVTVGTNRWNLGGQSYSLARNITHPYYRFSVVDDLSFLVTTEDIVMSDRVAVVPISFDHIGGGVAARVAGWGNIRLGGPQSTQLLELALATLDGQRCEEDMARVAAELDARVHPVISYLEICTFHSVGHGTCNHDSGGPLVRASDGQLIGVVARGLPCARGAPDVFVRLSAYKDWIMAVIA